MPDVLVVSDSAAVRGDVRSCLFEPETTVREAGAGTEVLPAVRERMPDLVVIDLQIGNMGGMATCLDLRLEESTGSIGHVAVLMLLDRRADVFLARRSQADGWLVKPLDPMRMRRAVQALLGGGTYFDEAYKPTTVAIGPPTTIGADGK